MQTIKCKLNSLNTYFFHDGLIYGEDAFLKIKEKIGHSNLINDKNLGVAPDIPEYFEQFNDIQLPNQEVK